MSKPALLLNFIGRFGNRLFQYASARARAEREGLEIHCHKWEGQFLFENCDNPLPDGTETLVHTGFYDGYCQRQEDIDHYSRADCRRWFKLHPEVEAALDCEEINPHHEYAFHYRKGDYANLGYVVVSRRTAQDHFNQIKFLEDRSDSLLICSEEEPLRNRMFPDHVNFMPDFYRLMTARVLYRSNSSFSWWAAVLGCGETVYSPVVAGLEGGREHDCQFVLGNHPRFCDLPGCSDLYLRER